MRSTVALLIPDKTDETSARIPSPEPGRIVVDVPSRPRMLAAVSVALIDPGPEPGDWPKSWWSDFDAMAAENRRIGYHPGEAAELAYANLRSRAALPWRAEIAQWPIERRQAWGDRASTLQLAGVAWQEASKRAFDESKDRV